MAKAFHGGRVRMNWPPAKRSFDRPYRAAQGNPGCGPSSEPTALDFHRYIFSCTATISPARLDHPSTRRRSHTGAADPLLAENSFYLEWGEDDASRQRRWREFLAPEDPKEQSIRRADWVVGDESFQKRLQDHQGRAVQRRCGRPPKSGGQVASISS